MPTHKKIHSCKPLNATLNQSLQESIFFSHPRRIFPNPSFLKNLFPPTHGLSRKPTMTATNVNRFVDKFVRNTTRNEHRTDRRASANMGLNEMAGEAVNQTVVLSIKFFGRRTVSAFKPPLR